MSNLKSPLFHTRIVWPFYPFQFLVRTFCLKIWLIFGCTVFALSSSFFLSSFLLSSFRSSLIWSYVWPVEYSLFPPSRVTLTRLLVACCSQSLFVLLSPLLRTDFTVSLERDPIHRSFTLISILFISFFPHQIICLTQRVFVVLSFANDLDTAMCRLMESVSPQDINIVAPRA